MLIEAAQEGRVPAIYQDFGQKRPPWEVPDEVSGERGHEHHRGPKASGPRVEKRKPVDSSLRVTGRTVRSRSVVEVYRAPATPLVGSGALESSRNPHPPQSEQAKVAGIQQFVGGLNELVLGPVGSTSTVFDALTQFGSGELPLDAAQDMAKGGAEEIRQALSVELNQNHPLTQLNPQDTKELFQLKSAALQEAGFGALDKLLGKHQREVARAWVNRILASDLGPTKIETQLRELTSAAKEQSGGFPLPAVVAYGIEVGLLGAVCLIKDRKQRANLLGTIAILSVLLAGCAPEPAAATQGATQSEAKTASPTATSVPAPVEKATPTVFFNPENPLPTESSKKLIKPAIHPPEFNSQKAQFSIVPGGDMGILGARQVLGLWKQGNGLVGQEVRQWPDEQAFIKEMRQYLKDNYPGYEIARFTQDDQVLEVLVKEVDGSYSILYGITEQGAVAFNDLRMAGAADKAVLKIPNHLRPVFQKNPEDGNWYLYAVDANGQAQMVLITQDASIDDLDQRWVKMENGLPMQEWKDGQLVVVERLPTRWDDPEVMETVKQEMEAHQAYLDEVMKGKQFIGVYYPADRYTVSKGFGKAEASSLLLSLPPAEREKLEVYDLEKSGLLVHVVELGLGSASPGDRALVGYFAMLDGNKWQVMPVLLGVKRQGELAMIYVADNADAEYALPDRNDVRFPDFQGMRQFYLDRLFKPMFHIKFPFVVEKANGQVNLPALLELISRYKNHKKDGQYANSTGPQLEAWLKELQQAGYFDGYPAIRGDELGSQAKPKKLAAMAEGKRFGVIPDKITVWAK